MVPLSLSRFCGCNRPTNNNIQTKFHLSSCYLQNSVFGQKTCTVTANQTKFVDKSIRPLQTLVSSKNAVNLPDFKFDFTNSGVNMSTYLQNHIANCTATCPFSVPRLECCTLRWRSIPTMSTKTTYARKMRATMIIMSIRATVTMASVSLSEFVRHCVSDALFHSFRIH